MPPAPSMLRLAERLPPDEQGVCAFYAPGILAPAGWESVDVRGHCHRHQEVWGESLSRWHADVMAAAAAATPWAWLCPGSRLHVWQEPVRPLLFALGLLRHFRESPGADVVAVGCPDEVGVYVDELSGGAVQVRGRKGRHDGRAMYRRIRRRAIEAASIARRAKWLRRDPVPKSDVDLVVVTFGLSADGIRQRGDHFFGRVLDSHSFSTHWIYHLQGSAGRAGIEAAVRESGRAHTFDHALVSWADLMTIAVTSARIRRRLASIADSVPELHIDGAVSRRFPRRYFEDLFLHTSVATDLVLYRAVARVVASVSPRAVCYPYEEKGLEHGLLMACKQAGSVRTIAFAHAAYNTGHLYLRQPGASTLRPPRPAIIAAAGSGFGPWLAAECGRAERVVSVGSPRWRESDAAPRTRAAGAPFRVLVLTGFPSELLVLAEWADRCGDIFDGCDVTIRPNPQEWHREQRDAIARLQRAAAVRSGGQVPLAAEVAAADVVMYCATSAVAEAIWHGRVAVRAELSDLWAADPLHGRGQAAGVPHCATPAALRATLREIAGMDQSQYDRVVAAQRTAATQVYAPFDDAGFAALVMGET